MELATALDHKRSPLAQARLQRQLPVREAAAKAGLTEDEVSWLEEGRVYRFRSPDDALLALMLYATALEIDHHEAREIAGLRVGPRPFRANPRTRLAVLAGVAAAAVALTAAFVIPGHAEQRAREAQASRLAAEAALPKPWQIDVDVLNGNGDIVFTRRVASRVGALGYHIARVRRANRFDYPETSVYYERGGYDVAARLARQLGVGTRPLPGGDNRKRLVVIVGPHRGPRVVRYGAPRSGREVRGRSRAFAALQARRGIGLQLGGICGDGRSREALARSGSGWCTRGTPRGASRPRPVPRARATGRGTVA